MLRKSLVLVAAFALAACGGGTKPGPKPTGAQVQTTAKSNQSALKAQKPATPMKVTAPPKPLPPAKQAGSTTVAPPDPTKGGTVEVETWTFESVDLDGAGGGESGVILADATNLLALWSGAFVDEQGTTVTYDALLWIEGENSVGFIFDYGASGALACASTASGTGGCVVCGADGSCVESGLSQ